MKPIEVKFSVQLIYIFLFFLYSCNLIEERNLATNKTVRTSCNCDSLQKEVIYNRSVNAYSSCFAKDLLKEMLQLALIVIAHTVIMYSAIMNSILKKIFI
jgi:hypothetical protein